MITLPIIEGLGTTWWVEIFAELTPEQTGIIYDDLCLLINKFDDNYSRFKPESQISELNTSHHLSQPSAEILSLLSLGQKLYRDTNETFNILVGEQLEATGYDALYSFIPKDNHLTAPDPTDVLHLSPEKITLRLGHVDIGGFGKGFLIDLLVNRLLTYHFLPYFIINGGGDMYATSEYGKPVTIYLEHPNDGETIIASTNLLNEGFAASSTIKRRWEKDGKIYSHIIDTKANISADTEHGVFVKAPSAALADGWATTLILTRAEDHLDKMSAESIRAAIYTTHTNTLHRYGDF